MFYFSKSLYITKYNIFPSEFQLNVKEILYKMNIFIKKDFFPQIYFKQYNSFHALAPHSEKTVFKHRKTFFLTPEDYSSKRSKN